MRLRPYRKESNAKAVFPQFRERIVALPRSGKSVSGLSYAGGSLLRSQRGVSFSQKVRDAGLAPSMGAIDAPYDNAMVEAF